MVLALCILGVAFLTLLVVALVDRPTVRPTHLPAPVPPRHETLDPYVMR